MPECQLAIKAVPNASRSAIVGWLGGALKIKLKAPPVDGKANAELCRFIAQVLDLPKTAIYVTTGDTSRLKLVQITGLTLDEARSRLGEQ